MSDPTREALTAILDIVEETSGSLPTLDRRAVENIARAALSTTPAPDQCAVLSGMDTDGDTGPGALIAGMGVEGFARMVVEEVRRLRESYEEGLREPLDTAWAAAEAALPEGWRIEGVMLVDTSDDEDLNVELVEWEAEASSDRGQRSVTALGPTPAAALLALADKLRESQP